MAFIITTTGTTSTVTFDDLGARTISHPTTIDLQQEYDIEELFNSDSIQSAITAGHITVSHNSQSVTNLSDYRVRISSTQMSSNNNAIAALQTGKEDVFTKNTAFNKDFGTSAGQVLEGDTPTITSTQASDIASNNSKVSFPEAPNDGKQYARKNLAWEEVAASATDSALPVIVLKSNDDTNTFTRTSPLMIPWSVEKYKDTGFSHSNSTNNTRMIVDDDSTYQFGGRIRVLNTSGQRTQPTIKVFVNGTEQDWNLASGYIRNSGSSSDYWTLDFTYEPEKLSINDYVELELSHEDSNPTTFTSTFIGTESAFWGIKLQGSKGDKGDPGSGSNIVVKKDGVTIGTLTETIDIIGAVPVVDEGSNETSIEIGNYAHATGITQMPSDQINEVSITSGSIDNYNIGNYNVHFINPGNSDRPFSGMVAPPAGVNRIVTIINSGTNGKIKFENNNSGSIAANRMLLADNNNFDLARGGSVQFIYKHSSNRWTTYTYY